MLFRDVDVLDLEVKWREAAADQEVAEEWEAIEG